MLKIQIPMLCAEILFCTHALFTVGDSNFCNIDANRCNIQEYSKARETFMLKSIAVDIDY